LSVVAGVDKLVGSVKALNSRSWPRSAGVLKNFKLRFLELRRVSVLALLIGALSGCGCGKNDPAIVALREMPSETYALLFQQAELTECKSRCEIPALDAFRDLATRRLVLRKHSSAKAGTTAEVVLKFCFDEGISLKLRGLDTSEGLILVSWGGSPPTYGEAMLWSRSAAKTTQ